MRERNVTGRKPGSRYVDPPQRARCTFTITGGDGSGVQCGRRRQVGELCTQHARMVARRAPEGRLAETPPVYTTHCVVHGAYKGRRATERTHTLVRPGADGADYSVLCDRVEVESLAIYFDEPDTQEPPTCRVCRRRDPRAFAGDTEDAADA